MPNRQPLILYDRLDVLSNGGMFFLPCSFNFNFTENLTPLPWCTCIIQIQHFVTEVTNMYSRPFSSENIYKSQEKLLKLNLSYILFSILPLFEAHIFDSLDFLKIICVIIKNYAQPIDLFLWLESNYRSGVKLQNSFILWQWLGPFISWCILVTWVFFIY